MKFRSKFSEMLPLQLNATAFIILIRVKKVKYSYVDACHVEPTKPNSL